MCVHVLVFENVNVREKEGGVSEEYSIKFNPILSPDFIRKNKIKLFSNNTVFLNLAFCIYWELEPYLSLSK